MQKGPPKRALRCGGKCGLKRKAPWRDPGRCEFVLPLFCCLSQANGPGVTSVAGAA
jgi:hypothetical protein